MMMSSSRPPVVPLPSGHPVGTAEALRNRLSALINAFPEGSVLVVGDMALDEMVYGVTERLSREAPVVLLRHDRTDCLLGAGGNAVHNVAALGAKRAVALGVMGDDYHQIHMREALQRGQVDGQFMLVDPSRPTTTKTRISGIASHSVTQQIVRIDRECRDPLSATLQQELLTRLARLLPQVDAVMLSDYALGVLSEDLIEPACALCREHNVRFFVDSHKPLSLFQGAYVMTPNLPEAEANVGYPIRSHDSLMRAGWQLLDTCHAENALITRSQEGMALFERDTRTCWLIPAFNRSEVFDVTGAGDTVIATFTLATAVGASPLEAAILGNLAASLVVRKFGAAVTSRDELHTVLAALPTAVLQGILDARLTAPEAVSG